jgi:hypothetical protein
MPKLPVAAFGSNMTPTVPFQKLDHFVDLHVVGARISASNETHEVNVCG